MNSKFLLVTLLSFVFVNANSQSISDYSFQFSGADYESVNLPDSNIYYNANHGFTWELWANPFYIPVGSDTFPNTNASQAMISAEDEASYQDIFLGLGWGNWQENRLTFSVDGAGEWRDWSTKYYVLPHTNQWYFITGVCNYDSSYTRLFVDGQLIGTSYSMKNNSGAVPITRNIPVSIGNITAYPMGGFQGLIDEVTMWNYPKSISEVTSDYSNCFNGTETGMVAYYRANEGTGTFTEDQTPNKLNGTLQNGASWNPEFAPKACLTSIEKRNTNPAVLRVYPSNKEGSYIVEINKLTGTSEIAITDMTGRVLHTSAITTNGNYMLNLADYSTGIYIVTLKNNSGVISSRKLVR